MHDKIKLLFIKSCINEYAIFFWRGSTGNEIDVIVEEGNNLIPVEIKAGQTVTTDFFKESVSGENYLPIMNKGQPWFTKEIKLIFDRKRLFIPGQYFNILFR